MTGIGQDTYTDQLQDLLLECKALADFVLGLALMPVSLLGGPTPYACSISVQRGGALTVAAGSNGQATRLDLLQQQLDEGPSLSALRGREPMVVPDLQRDGRWPRFSRAVEGEAIRAVLAVPVALDDSAGAVLSCYSASKGGVHQDAVTTVQEIALSMSRTVRIALSTDHHGAASEAWRAALQSRAVVDGAVALVMVQERCNRAEALLLLHQEARQENRTLLHEAGKIIQGKFPR